MPFGFWVLGNAAWKSLPFLRPILSQMPFGFWVLGNRRSQNETRNKNTRLKCLSAFGFWGTVPKQSNFIAESWGSQMPFGFWVLGNVQSGISIQAFVIESQMPFGFWVLGNQSSTTFKLLGSRLGLKCLSAFGFWGTS